MLGIKAIGNKRVPASAMDLNCDLGEGESPSRTRALMRWVTSANVACGGHAGDVRTLMRCVQAGIEFGVRLGAHPGVEGEFGRGAVEMDGDALALLVLHQASALDRILRLHGRRMHHVKLHGSLYHASDRDPILARAYVGVMKRCFPGVRIYSRVGGRVAHLARRQGVSVWEEAFVDRAYRSDGTLVPRGQDGAVIWNADQVRQRILDLRSGRGVESVNGTRVPLRPRTLCLHGDTPEALELVRTAATALQCG